MSRRRALVSAAGAALVVAVATAWWLRPPASDETPGGAQPAAATPAQVERGAYLARAGNCAGCHTARGGAAYAGGRGIATPFGTVYAGNLTPDVQTGIGAWSADDFWRALHHGRSRDGRLLYPVFPYPNYTQVTREDADAIHAYLRTLAPAARANKPHALRFPYDTQAALAVWRAFFFSPGVYRPQADKSAPWNRGAYLVKGLGHCDACHSPRNIFGATQEATGLSGGAIPMQNWYAPSLTSASEAGVADWPAEHVVELLKTGVSPRASVMGPMAEVVFRSTQHLSDEDLQAMAVFLKDLPPTEAHRVSFEPASAELLEQGAMIYAQHCSACHGKRGQGAPGAYPPLAGNRAVTLGDPGNAVNAVVNGGFPPTTGGNPQPYGMPPFGPTLSDAEIAAVVSYIRGAWGNKAGPVSQLEVLRAR